MRDVIEPGVSLLLVEMALLVSSDKSGLPLANRPDLRASKGLRVRRGSPGALQVRLVLPARQDMDTLGRLGRLGRMGHSRRCRQRISELRQPTGGRTSGLWL